MRRVCARLALFVGAAGAAAEQRNVLLVVIDDLRPQLGAYGHGNGAAGAGASPHIDALARGGVVFDNAFTNYPFCAPSRNSFMSGRSPDTTKAWNFINHFREVGPAWTSLPQHFKQHGYWAAGSGKLYHPNKPPDEDNPLSWSINFTDPDGPNGNANAGCACPCFLQQNETHWAGGPHAVRAGCSHCVLDDDVVCPDVEIRDTVAAQVRDAATDPAKRPFFLGLGIHKPHLPWAVPRRFWDRQAPADNVSLAGNPLPPNGMPAIAYHQYTWAGFPYGVRDDAAVTGAVTLPAQVARESRRGYYAAVSFADDCVGAAVAALDDTGLAASTVVAVTGDHGWQLGEHGEWCKQTLFDVTLRVPLIIRAPGVAPRRTAAFAELLDLYKTLSDLAGLPAPEEGVEGTSLAGVVTAGAVGKEAAYSQMARCFTQYKRTDATCASPQRRFTSWGPPHDDCVSTPRACIEWMGYTVRTAAWRYTEWVRWDGGALRPDFAHVNATELYAHAGPDSADFSAAENDNVAADPQHAAAARELAALLRARFAA